MPSKQEQLAAAVSQHGDTAERLFQTLKDSTADDTGVTRVAYGSGEQLAHDLMADTAADLGLQVTEDHARNLYMTLPGRDRSAPLIITGSHLDSVPRGGNYDGAAGVIAGLVALAAIRETRLMLGCDLTVMAIRAEESAWFPQEHVGSRAALGILAKGELDTARRMDTNRTLGEHMLEAGCDTEALRAGYRHLEKERVRAFIELHIEQGPMLVERGLPLGIVTAIRGNFRAREAVCVGEYAHAGAVPRNMRRDAVMATAEFIQRLKTIWEEIEGRGGDLVLNVGKLSTDPVASAVSKVPGEVRFTLEVRSQDQATLNEVMSLIHEAVTSISKRRQLNLDLGRLVQLEPAQMAPALRTLLATGCAQMGLEAMDMPSGSGHDAAEFARTGIPSAMIFIRNPRGSHNPHEHMELADFIQGVQLLAWALVTESGTDLS